MIHRLKQPARALAIAAAALLLLTSPVLAQGRPLVASLAGGANGDRDGSGYVWLELNQGAGSICFEMAIQGTGPVSNLRIVDLESGRALLLLLNGVGTTSDCVDADKALIKQIRQNVSDYGVVVGTSQYPVSALSGALTTPSAARPLPATPAPDADSDDNGPGNSADAPGQNKPDESPLDHDNGRGNDDKKDDDNDAANPGNGNGNQGGDNGGDDEGGDDDDGGDDD